MAYLKKVPIPEIIFPIFQILVIVVAVILLFLICIKFYSVIDDDHKFEFVSTLTFVQSIGLAGLYCCQQTTRPLLQNPHTKRGAHRVHRILYVLESTFSVPLLAFIWLLRLLHST